MINSSKGFTKDGRLIVDKNYSHTLCQIFKTNTAELSKKIAIFVNEDPAHLDFINLYGFDLLTKTDVENGMMLKGFIKYKGKNIYFEYI